MNKRCTELLIVSALLFASPQCTFAQSGTWAWMSGPSSTDNSPVAGNLGVPDVNNTPGGSTDDPTWVDQQGNFWLFGPNADSYSWMFKYNPGNGTWTCVNNVQSFYGTYDLPGVPDPQANPGPRTGAATWVDNGGNFWLYGGIAGDSAGETGAKNDLWMYSPVANQWTWMKGSSNLDLPAVYGAFQSLALGNTPGAREYCSAWTDANNNLWLFGGSSPQNPSSSYFCNDLWRYNITANEWAWMKGPAIGTSTPYNYGTMGVESPSNLPPPRLSSTHWSDEAGNFYIWAGADSLYLVDSFFLNKTLFVNVFAGVNVYSDVWKYNPLSNNWTWIAGDNSQNFAGNYQQYCTDNGYNGPPARWNNTTAQLNGCPSVFLTYGGMSADNNTLGDLWLFNPQTEHWKWVNGNETVDTCSYGTMGVPSASNIPAGRSGAYTWTDTHGSLWLYGGVDILGNIYNDVWKFTADTACFKLPDTTAISYQLSNSVICPGDQVELTLYNVSNPGISPSANIIWIDSSHVLLSPGTTTTYRISGHSTCRYYDTTSVTVQVISPVINISSDNNKICPGDSALLCSPAVCTSYHWSTGETTSCIYTKLAGIYTLTVSENNSCTATSNPFPVSIYTPTPVALTISGDTLTAYNDISYQWYFNGSLISGATSAIYIAPVSGLYSVTVIDSSGCQVTSTQQHIVAGLISPSATAQLDIYPNPLSGGNWKIEADNSFLGSSFGIFDSEGRIVYTGKIAGLHTEIEMGVAKGVYWLKIYLPGGSVVKKLVRL